MFRKKVDDMMNELIRDVIPVMTSSPRHVVVPVALPVDLSKERGVHTCVYVCSVRTCVICFCTNRYFYGV